MPEFGDYQTVGEPHATTVGRHYDATLWQVRKSGAAPGQPPYALKCIVPRAPHAPDGSSIEEKLAPDGRLEFIAVFKQVMQAQKEGGRGLAPLHDFGTTPETAWYVTDFYERASLRTIVAGKAKVDDAALRHVVGSVVTGCLALKQSGGRSHGNLKLTNVLRGGRARTQPLRNTPLLLLDPTPPSPQISFEAADLKALGEILLQLVRGQMIESVYDYDYPQKFSSDWVRLGKNGQKWLDLCNRLLDPNLSLDQINLSSLAAEFKPSASGRNLLVVGSVVAALGLVGGGIVLLHPARPRPEQVLAKAQDRFRAGDYGFTNDPQFLAFDTAAGFAALLKQAMDAAAIKAAAEEQLKAAADQAVLGKAQARFNSGDYGFTNEPDFLVLIQNPAFAALQRQAMDAAARLAASAKAAAAQKVLAKAQGRYEVGDYTFTNDPDFLALIGEPAFVTLRSQALEAVTKRDAALATETNEAKAAAEKLLLTKEQRRLDTGDYGFTNDPDFLALSAQPAFASLQNQAMAAATSVAQSEQEKVEAKKAVLRKATERFKSGDYGFTNEPDFLARISEPEFSSLQSQAMDAATQLAAKVAAQQKADSERALLAKEQARLNSGDFGFTNDADFLALVKEPAFASLQSEAMDAATQLAAKMVAQQKADSERALLAREQGRLKSGDYGFTNDADFLTLTNEPVFASLQSQAMDAATQLAAKVAAQQKADSERALLAKEQGRLSAGDYGFTNEADFLALTNEPEFASLQSQAMDAAAKLAEQRAADARAAAEQAVLAKAQNRLNAGDYGFTNDPDFQARANQPAFSSLQGQATSELALVAQLTQLQSQNDWPKVNSALAALPDATLQKPNFAEIKKWRDEHNPIAQLDKQLHVLDAIFIKRGSIAKNYPPPPKEPKDPSIESGKALFFGQPINLFSFESDETKDACIKMLENFEKQYQDLNAPPDRKKNIDALIDIIKNGNW